MIKHTIKSHFPHDEFYPFQKEILNILDANINKYKYFIIEAPPGIGKSPIARAFAKYFKQCDVITKQRRLQDQYHNKYSFYTAEGRGNFNCLQNALRCSRGECIITKNFKCDFNVTSDEPEGGNQFFAAHSHTRGQLYWKNLEKQCPYWKQKMLALLDGKVAHNYSYYLYETIFAGDFGGAPSMVCDEAHNIEFTIMDFVKVEITEILMEKIGQKLHNFATVDEWIMWLTTLSNHYIPRRTKEINEQLKLKFKNHNLIKERQDLETVKGKIDFFINNYETNPSGWLILPYMGKYGKLTKVEFKPLYADTFTEALLFKEKQKVILMSATILDVKQFIKSIGIPKNECLFIQVPSPFPVENRLVYKADIGKLNADAMNIKNPNNLLPKIVSSIDTILTNPYFADKKGIIHTTNYTICRYIEKHSTISPRMLFHKNSEEASEILKIHSETLEPTIIVSPSMSEGVDLYDELGRIQIIINVPYFNSKDPIINARRKQDIKWYNYITGVKLAQDLGRIVRNMDDYGTTICLDNRYQPFIEMLERQIGPKNFPQWISDSIRTKEELKEKFGIEL